jgi:curved DNA-binding protein
MDFTQEPGSERHTPGAGESVEWEDFGQFSDFFNSIFGGSAGRAGARRGGIRFTVPGRDVEAELRLTLEELLRGGKRRITLNGNRTLDVDIPLGAREGTVLRLAGQGEPGANGGPPGDLFIRVRTGLHPHYRVAGDDIEMDLPLWPWQALLGSEVRIETPDGPVNLKVPPGTQSGRRLRLRERGLPRKGGTRGDFYAIPTIVIPENPSAAEREAYEALKRHASSPADRPARK